MEMMPERNLMVLMMLAILRKVVLLITFCCVDSRNYDWCDADSVCVEQRGLNGKRGPHSFYPLSRGLQETHYCTKSPSDVAKMGKLC
jgi:hypothetical protein